MIEDTTIPDAYELKRLLTSIVNDTGLSSLEAISEQLEIPEEVAAVLISDLIQEGVVSGYLTEDQTRFYRSDLKKPDSQIRDEPEHPAITQADRGYSIYIPVAGLILFIAGQILHNTLGVINDGQYYNITSGIVMGGLVILILGLIYISLIDSRKE